MNILNIDCTKGWQLAGWTMCYFLAIGTVVVLVGALLRFICKRAVPQIRYTVSLTVFGVLAVLPLVIALRLTQNLPAPPADLQPVALQPAPIAPQIVDLKDNPNFKQSNMPVLSSPSVATTPAIEIVKVEQDEAKLPLATTTHQQYEDIRKALIDYLPWLWIVGTPLTFLLLTTGLIGSQRLRKKSQQLIDDPVHTACERLRASLRISRHVGIAINQRIASPVLIGIVRPLILLPPAALTGWSPEQLEMVLLHELAHVRRWDNLVNFVQRVVESLLFFHPCVWWVSRWVRRDREECVDAVVVAHTAKPHAYAELLVALATPSSPIAGLAMAQHPLAGRIRRILKLEEERMLVSRGTFGWLGLVAVAVLAIGLWQPAADTVAQESKQVAAEKKELTTGDTENAEEKRKSSGKEQVVLSFGSKIPTSESQKVVEHYQALGYRKLSIRTDEKNSTVQIGERTPRRFIVKGDLIYIGGRPEKLKQATSALPTRSNKDWAEHRFALKIPARYTSIPSQLAIWQETQKALIKSQLVLQQAVFSNKILPLPIIQRSKPDPVSWLQENLEVSFPDNESITIKLKSFAETQSQRQKILQAIALVYKKEIEVSSSLAASQNEKQANSSASPFPTLEAQRDADLIYKRLGFELKPLNKQELQVVKKLGYEGGMHIVESSRTNTPKSGDLLLGLYIWPTTSIQDVITILQRDNIRDLSPVKYYAARKGWYSGAPQEYQVFSRRISVRFPKKSSAPASARTITLRADELAPGDRVKVAVTGAFPDQPIDGVYTLESMGTLPLGPTYGRVKVAGKTVIEAEPIIKRHLLKILTDVEVQVTMVEKNAPKQTITKSQEINGLPSNARQSASIPQKTQLLIELQKAKANLNTAKAEYEIYVKANKKSPKAVGELELKKKRAQVRLAELVVKRTEALIKDLSQAPNEKSTLLYDNKTFDQWRSLWKNELKTERRIEAIKAMAAFGRAGYGKEAAEAILDVAGEYDFSPIPSGVYRDDPAANLKQEIREILYARSAIQSEDWVPLLLERLKQNPRRWQGFAASILGAAYSEQPEIQSQLLATAKNEAYTPAVRSGALAAIVYSDFELKNQEHVNLLHVALASKETKLLNAAVSALYFRHLDKLPEQLELFFHPEDSVRTNARSRLGNNQNWLPISDHLLSVLDNPERASDHENTIIALGMHFLLDRSEAAKQKQIVIDRLYEVLISGDKDLLPSALRALKKLKNWNNAQVIRQIEKKVTPKRRDELATAVEILKNTPLRNNGGFGGGGGGGFF